LSKLAEIIRKEIWSEGVISFARFAELALYCPVYGYYEKEADSIGRRGDYYTSASVGPLFGQLLAFQFARWLKEFSPGAGALQIVEAGAHDGKLACDVLTWLSERETALYERLEYWIVEPSERRSQWQKENLADRAPKVRWAGALSGVTVGNQVSAGVHGVIFSNELLDSFPRHRVGWDAAQKTWFEWCVGWENERFTFVKKETALRPAVADELLAVLPDGFTTEMCPSAESWWREAAQALGRGKLLAIDYGWEADEFFQPERSRGTLRAYRNHTVSDDVLADPGEQDITAHVNFTELRNAGESTGLKTDAFVTQEQFLTEIVAEVFKEPNVFGVWAPKHSRQLQTLVHPQHLGRSFRVLVQSRGKP
jgi:SAM-dependent MidA family methyltransferase